MERPRLIIDVGGQDAAKIEAWFLSLKPDEQYELYQLELSWYAGEGYDVDLAEVCQDWVEEHNGRREWWQFITVSQA